MLFRDAIGRHVLAGGILPDATREDDNLVIAEVLGYPLRRCDRDWFHRAIDGWFVRSLEQDVLQPLQHRPIAWRAVQAEDVIPPMQSHLAPDVAGVVVTVRAGREADLADRGEIFRLDAEALSALLRPFPEMRSYRPPHELSEREEPKPGRED